MSRAGYVRVSGRDAEVRIARTLDVASSAAPMAARRRDDPSNAYGILMRNGIAQVMSAFQPHFGMSTTGVYPQAALFVVSGIKLEKLNTASGGQLHIIRPWDPSAGALTPISYRYEVP